MEENCSNSEYQDVVPSELRSPVLPLSGDKKNTIWRSETALNKNYESRLPLPSFTVTAPPFNNASESKFLYFPRKFSMQAFRKLSGSSVSGLHRFLLFDWYNV